MEFHSKPPSTVPKMLHPCLASITIAPPSEHAGHNHPGGASGFARRLSTSSGGAHGHGDKEENPLQRIMSGGRRKSSAVNVDNGHSNFPGHGGASDTTGSTATAATTNVADRRKSIAPSAAFSGKGGVTHGSNATGPEGVERGTWFWRVQAGVVGTDLVLLPLSDPPNPLLTAPPQPLSSVIPGKHAGGAEDEGLVDKLKNMFRRSSTVPAHEQGSTTGGDKIADQDAQGEVADPNVNAETGWPGIVAGKKLGAIVIPLTQVERSNVRISGGKRAEASWVTVPVTSFFAGMIQGHADGASAPKSGTIKLEFDKNWIGSKGEAELLHWHITSALQEQRATQAPPQIKLGQSGAGHNVASSHPNPGMEERQAARRASAIHAESAAGATAAAAATMASAGPGLAAAAATGAPTPATVPTTTAPGSAAVAPSSSTTTTTAAPAAGTTTTTSSSAPAPSAAAIAASQDIAPDEVVPPAAAPAATTGTAAAVPDGSVASGEKVAGQ